MFFHKVPIATLTIPTKSTPFLHNLKTQQKSRPKKHRRDAFDRKKRRITSCSDKGLHCISWLICSSRFPCVFVAAESKLIFFINDFCVITNFSPIWVPEIKSPKLITKNRNPGFQFSLWIFLFLERERNRENDSGERVGKEKGVVEIPMAFLESSSCFCLIWL